MTKLKTSTQGGRNALILVMRNMTKHSGDFVLSSATDFLIEKAQISPEVEKLRHSLIELSSRKKDSVNIEVHFRY